MKVDSRVGSILAWGAISGLIVYLYGFSGNAEQLWGEGPSAVRWLVGRWNWAGTDMAHGWLIPCVSAYVLWTKRDALRNAPKAVSWGGLGIIAAALLTYLLGMRVEQTRIVLLSLVILLPGIAYFLYGRHVAGHLLFPCSYLVFCIPVTFLDILTFPLRIISTAVSAALLNGMAIPVTRVGTALQVHAGGGFALEVAHPCSGLRYLFAMVALTTAYAYFTQRTAFRRGLLCVLSIPLAMAGNIVRIVLIAVVGVWINPAVAIGFYHDYSGYVVFGVATLLMVGIGNLMERAGASPEARTPATGRERRP